MNDSSESKSDESDESVGLVIEGISGKENKKKKSKFGSFFHFVEHNKVSSAKCKICAESNKKKFIKTKNGNTSGMKRHLYVEHRIAYYTLFPNENRGISVKNFFQSNNAKVPVKDFTASTVDWIVAKYLPFSFFDDKLTQMYFEQICPDQNFPKKDTLRRHVKFRFEELLLNLKNLLAACNSKMSFTIDGWTSIAGRSFYGITIHFIDVNWNLQSMVLDFIPSNGQHTGEDIANIFLKCLTYFGLNEKIQGITVDNASANTKCMTTLTSLLPDFDADDQHFRCMAHILNLGVQDLMKTLALHNQCEEILNCSYDEDEEYVPQIESSETPILKLRTIFSKIKRSEVLKNKFRSACEASGVSTSLSPVLDCPTRWGSTHDMLGVSLKLKHGINTLCSITPDLKQFQICDVEWQIFEKMYAFLQNFKTLTEKLGGDKYVTLPMVIVSFNLLLDKIEKNITKLDNKPDRNSVDEKLIVAFQAARDKMLKHYNITNWMYCVILILDPRHKVETFSLTSWGSELKDRSLKKFEAIYNIYYDKEPELENAKENSLIEDSDDDIVDFNQLYSAVICSQNKNKELEEYLSLPRADGKEDILNWWKRHENQFPVLAKMARDFLSIPATSVPSERLFSKASLVIRKHRNKLNSESARWLLCINSWAPILQTK